MCYLNRYLCLAAFLVCSLLSKAQFDSEKYDKESFLLGMLDEYMGYQRVFKPGVDGFNYHRVDVYLKGQLGQALFIDSLFSTDCPDIFLVNNGAPKGIKLYSAALSAAIDKYFDYKPSWNKTLKGDTIYSGDLRQEMLKTEKQKLSYLLGAFMRFGNCETKEGEPGKDKKIMMEKYPDHPGIHMMDRIDPNKKDAKCIKYCIETPNAPRKAQLCAQLLMELWCEEVQYIFYKGYFPSSYFAIFKPSEKIQRMIDDAEHLKSQIAAINTDKIKFTPDGKKYVWVEPYRPTMKKSK
ncbi:hypothetical protein [Parabacteroides sp. FAFU027]|uniref:hypothetical protein n=1 Tax=Parabacteroides sp. FAFU027 TaxID=2922715 RepID=UPI001FB01143|nr:hypothetical protein [Parabacteroides sp. FAFU027]